MFEKRRVSPMYFLGLLYLVFPLYFNWGTPRFWLVAALTLGFGWCYISILYTTSRRYEQLAWWCCIAYICYTTFWGNIQFSLFLFNLSNLLTWHYPEETISPRTISYGSLLLATLVWSLIGGFPFETVLFVWVLHLFGLFMLIVGRLQVRKEMAEQTVREQNASINLLMAENERNRIGQDLHDSLGHFFAMLAVKSELTETLLEQGLATAAKKEVAELHQLTKTAMSEVRQIVHNLGSHSLSDEWQILQQMLTLAGVELTVTGHELLTPLPEPVQSKLVMILRELGTNLLKHSQASTCRFTITCQGESCTIDYEDNGIGFAKLDGTELTSIRQRLVTIKGSLAILSTQSPTHIRLTIPYEKE